MKGVFSMKKQKKNLKVTNISKKDKYIHLLNLSKDLTDTEIEEVKNFVLSLKSQRSW